MKKLKVLVIGSEVSDFLCPMYKKMQEDYPLHIDLIEPRKEWRNQELINASFVTHHKISTELKSYSKAQQLSSIFKSKFWKTFLQTFNTRESVRSGVVQANFTPLMQGYDVICFHNLSTPVLWLHQFVPAGKKLVYSFWGSDLFRNNWLFHLETQAEALKKAQHIIVHSMEMRLIAMAKYGWQYENKITALVSTDIAKALEKYSDNDQLRDKYLFSFKQRHNIASEDTLVTIGHSAHEIDNHLFILQQIARLDKQVLNKCTFILPMTYGIEADYFNEVEAACKAANIKYIILNQFLEDDEMMELRYASEILIRLSKYDAFSLSLCETLAAGNIAIVATWLPYGALRSAAVFYKEINAFEKLPQMLCDVLENKEKYKQDSRNNGKKISDIYRQQNTIATLAKIYMS